MKILKGFVRTDKGDVLVQLPEDNEFGFVLADNDQSWPEGFGIAHKWELLDEDEVSEGDRARLGWLLEDQGEDNENTCIRY